MSKVYVDFLQDYSLYRRCKIEDSNIFNEFKDTAIYMHCKECGSEQSFVHYESLYGKEINKLLNAPASDIRGGGTVAIPNPVSFISKWKNIDNFIINLDFICKGCGKFHRYFSIKIIDDFTSIIKIGQHPPYDISVPSDISKALGRQNTALYSRGLICESQGYGIAAYAYYRRIVESLIDNLLNDISELIENRDDKKRYEEALEKTRTTTVTQDKIEFVKDLLPCSLRPGGLNPLGILHSTLSEGLHSLSDEDCIEISEEIKTALEYLVSEVMRHQHESKKFTESMIKLLEKRSKRTSL